MAMRNVAKKKKNSELLKIGERVENRSYLPPTSVGKRPDQASPAHNKRSVPSKPTQHPMLRLRSLLFEPAIHALDTFVDRSAGFVFVFVDGV